MLDLLIRGGTVVTPEGAGFWDVGVQGETIAAVAPTGTLPEESASIIDASGKIVVPGGIDPHVHSNWGLPNADGSPGGLSAGPEQVSQAALFGGTTTWIDFALWEPGETLQQTLERRDAEWKGSCSSDYAFHVMLQGSIPPEVVEQIPELIQAGFP